MLLSAEYFYAFAGTSISSVLGYFAYKKIRPRYPIKVNCWFCNKDTIVPFGNQNCWDCPFCDQYNGFQKDGDYNKPIPSQHVEEFNHPITGVNQSSDNFLPFKNSGKLCGKCNRNQQLKVKQLSQFQPLCEESYDGEVEVFSKHLDRVYRLCRQCESTLHAKLCNEAQTVQNVYLDHQLNESSDQDTAINRCIYFGQVQNNTSLLLRTSAILLTILLLICDIQFLQQDSGVVVFPLSAVLPSVVLKAIHYFGIKSCTVLSTSAIFCIVFAVFSSGRYRLQTSDGLTCFIWIIVLFVHNEMISFFLPKQDFMVLRPLISFLGLLLTIISTACRRYTLYRSLKKPSFKPSSTKKMRSLDSSMNSDMWEDASSFASNSCHSYSNYSEFAPPIRSTKSFNQPLNQTVNSPFHKHGELTTLPNDFFGLKISPYANQTRPNDPFAKEVGVALPYIKQDKEGRDNRRNHLSSVIKPSKLDYIRNLYQQPQPLTRSSWVAGGFWDNSSVSGQLHGSIDTNSHFSSSLSTTDRFSMWSEPSTYISTNKGIKNNSSFADEKTSEYGSDSQLSHTTSQWRKTNDRLVY